MGFFSNLDIALHDPPEPEVRIDSLRVGTIVRGRSGSLWRIDGKTKSGTVTVFSIGDKQNLEDTFCGFALVRPVMDRDCGSDFFKEGGAK